MMAGGKATNGAQALAESADHEVDVGLDAFGFGQAAAMGAQHPQRVGLVDQQIAPVLLVQQHHRLVRVDVVDPSHPLTKDLPESFETVDEPYMVEIQHPSETQFLLTAELGPDNSPPGTGFEYDEDTALQPDGKTRVLGFVRNIGKGGVTYIALGHRSAPRQNKPVVDPNLDRAAASPAVLATTWESDAYIQLLRNAIAWGVN